MGPQGICIEADESKGVTEGWYEQHDHKNVDKSNIVVVIPAYNEEKCIGTVVLIARQHAQSVIVVDDGSTDKTSYVAKLAGAKVVSHQKNLGKAAALNTGLNLARKHYPNSVVTFDGDGQHLPEELLKVAAPVLANEADLVIGSRYLQPCHIPLHRVWGHLFVNFITGFLSSVFISDSQSGYRAFSPKAISKMRFRSSGFSVESEMQFLAQKERLRIVETPISVRYDDKPKRPVLTHGIMVLKGLVILSERYRPIAFFGLSGLILLFSGLLWQSVIGNRLSDAHLFVLHLNICSTFCYLLGTLALFAAIILHPIRLWLSDLQIFIADEKNGE